eukprot:Protomagalhaensia_wolfi_Nauph_80__3831@NODE_3880_length_687_cov_2_942901_g3066_i0_p1_GENE_NODE_3880_length_687_cov_2_942901_g3066_i0NODE_3880_length_687_cov_2_942901_g3066_i0_p1_ORF_typecomplete_len151_score10_43TMEM234/PF10639_9/2_9e27EamA/PF00892_20/9e05TPT/PF03151_16/0_0043Sugar_transport/PF06800_12/1_6e02Sugar_transport/PF06800_12/0_11CRTlike/PF08627_10/0_034Multi_Drug_Res/PF00893_19/0_13_NODE_3880_length_687_cov_2_942901_g3066_i0186638
MPLRMLVVWLYLVTGLLWGVTSPFIKSGLKSDETAEMEKTKGRLMTLLDRAFGAGFSELFRWRVLLPYGLNQLGSVSFMFLLGQADISKAVPIANALAALFTLLTESCLLRNRTTTPSCRLLDNRELCGCLCILVGVALCCGTDRAGEAL